MLTYAFILLHTLALLMLSRFDYKLMMVQFWMYSLQTFPTLLLMDLTESCLKRAFYDNLINSRFFFIYWYTGFV